MIFSFIFSYGNLVIVFRLPPPRVCYMPSQFNIILQTTNIGDDTYCKKNAKRRGAQNWISEEGVGRFKYQDSF